MLLTRLLPRRRDRRNLASAFAGEIAAAIEAVAEHPEVRRLQLVQTSAGERPFDFSHFKLPKLAVYEANADKLSLFDAPLPRELSYFYTRLADLPQRLLAVKPPGTLPAEDLKSRTKSAIDEITQTMTLGDDLLRSIKVLISRKQPASISRA
jgi:hypothetical protein